MRYLGIDYGTKRVGFSISDENGTFAMPLNTIVKTNNLVKEIEALCNKHKVEEIVIGESKDFSGKDNAVMAEITELVTDLTLHIGLPVHLQNEMFTSAQAGRVAPRRQDKHSLGRGAKGANKKVVAKDLDSSAAALILQAYLDS
jgi:putative Holliday junction resolvase